MDKVAEMHIDLCKEEIDNLSPSEKQVVLNSLHDVKKNGDLVDEYLTEASHGESDETMSITCGDFFKVVEYYQGNLCIACFLPSFREIFRSDCVGKVYKSHENADETEENNDTDEIGSEVEIVNIDKWLCDEMQMANDAMDSINKKIAQAAKGEPVTCTLEELDSLKKSILIMTLRLATDSDFRLSFSRRMIPQALREIQKEIHKKVQEKGRG